MTRGHLMPLIHIASIPLRRRAAHSRLLAVLVCGYFFTGVSLAAPSPDTTWIDIESRGLDQEVYFHAWGGNPQINQYIQWIAKRVNQEYRIDLHQVKLTNTGEAVSRVLTEKSAGNHDNGQVDMVWINGENFASMAEHHLLTPNWVSKLPHFKLTNPDHNPAMTRDFGVPTQGMEAPWGQASLAFYYDSMATDLPPQTLPQLLHWSQVNPGRFTYPKPPDFLAMSFLKYALIVLNDAQPDSIKQRLYRPASPQAEAALLPVLWQFLDRLHPNLWRKGQHFVSSGMALPRLVGDGELSLAFTFSAAEVPAAIGRFDLPSSARSYKMQDGSLSNIHFIAIPYNAAHSDSAKLVINFLLSPEAQAKKQQIEVWGDSTVLDFSLLTPQQQALFDTTTLGQDHPDRIDDSSPTATPSIMTHYSASPALSEPHPSWTHVIAQQWLSRYGAQQ